MPTVVEALWFVLGGMAIVFATLLTLMGVMIILGWLLKPKEEGKGQGESGSSPPSTPSKPR